MRKSMMAVFFAAFLFICLFMAGWKGANRSKEAKDFDQKMFLVGKEVAQYEGVYLQHGRKCYTLADSIGASAAEEYGIGTKVYHWIGSTRVLTVDDFEPLVAKGNDTIASYAGKVEFYPVEFVQYSFLGYVGTPGTGFYYWDPDAQYEKMAFPREACVVYDSSDKALKYEQIEQGETYTLRWNDMYGYNVVEMPPANCRLYEKTSKDPVEVTATVAEDGHLEYLASDFEEGTYAIVTQGKYGPKFGGLMTIK